MKLSAIWKQMANLNCDFYAQIAQNFTVFIFVIFRCPYSSKTFN